MSDNMNTRVVDDFGAQWKDFPQESRSSRELERDLQIMFDSYFAIFPWASLPAQASGLDAGCGTGRWAQLVVRWDDPPSGVEPRWEPVGGPQRKIGRAHV